MPRLLSIDRTASRLGTTSWLVNRAIENGKLNAIPYRGELHTTETWVKEWLGESERGL
jgi:hypothetical protein